MLEHVDRDGALIPRVEDVVGGPQQIALDAQRQGVVEGAPRQPVEPQQELARVQPLEGPGLVLEVGALGFGSTQFEPRP